MSLFTAVEMAPRDPILGLNEQFNADTNPNKVNLGVGVYFDDNGKLPLLKCVQAVEKQMTDAPKPRGDAGHGAEAGHTLTKRGRAWAVHDPAGELVALVLYRKGAAEVVRRLDAGTEARP